MKIPTYTSQARPTSERAGRSITARIPTEPFVRAELEKGNVAASVAAGISEFADMRYKMAREGLVNDAVLAAQDQLKEETLRLSKSKDIYKVLDGDNPLWDQATKGINDTLRATLGNDRVALAHFDESFKRHEMSNRYNLRGVIDAKIQRAMEIQRANTLRRIENDAVSAQDYKSITLLLDDAGIDSDRINRVLGGNINALKQQEYAMIKRIAGRRLDAILANTDKPITAISKLREAILQGNESALVDPSLNGKGIVEAELLKLLSLDDQQAYLKAGETSASYIAGPTLEQKLIAAEEKKAAEVAKGQASVIKDQADTMFSAIEKNEKVDVEDISSLQLAFKELSKNLSAEDAEAGMQQLYDLAKFRNLANDLSTFTDPADMEAFMQPIFEGAATGDPNVIDEQDLKFIDLGRKYIENAKKQILEDPISWAKTQGDLNEEVELDLSFADPAATRDSLVTRYRNAAVINKAYGRTDKNLPIQMFSADEMKQFVTSIENADMGKQRQMIAVINDAAIPKAVKDNMFRQISKDLPFVGHLSALISDQGVLSPVVEEAQMGLMLDNQYTMNPDQKLAFNQYLTGATSMLPVGTANNLYNSTNKIVGAVLSKRVMRDGIDPNEIDEDEIRALVSYALGGSKDGEVGGLGYFREDKNFTYFRPDGVTDDQFMAGVQALDIDVLNEMALNGNVRGFGDDPNVAAILAEVADKDNYSVFVARKDEQGRHVYQFAYGDVGSQQVVRTDDDMPVEFIFEEIAPALETVTKRREEAARTETEANIKAEAEKFAEAGIETEEVVIGGPEPMDKTDWQMLVRNSQKITLGDTSYAYDVRNKRAYNIDTKQEVTGEMLDLVKKGYELDPASFRKEKWSSFGMRLAEQLAASPTANIDEFGEEAYRAWLQDNRIKEPKIPAEKIIGSIKAWAKQMREQDK